MNTIKIDFDNRDLLSSFDDINKEVVKLEKEINNLDSTINNLVFFNDSNKIFESIESGSSIAISSIDNINNSIDSLDYSISSIDFNKFSSDINNIFSGVDKLYSSVSSSFNSFFSYDLSSYNDAIEDAKKKLKEFDDFQNSLNKAKKEKENEYYDEYISKLDEELEYAINNDDIMTSEAIKLKKEELKAQKEKEKEELLLSKEVSRQREELEKNVAQAEYKKAYSEWENQVKLAEIEKNMAIADSVVIPALAIAQSALGVSSSFAQGGPAGFAAGLVISATTIASAVSAASSIVSASNTLDTVKSNPPLAPQFAFGTTGYNIPDGGYAIVGEMGAEVVRNVGGKISVESNAQFMESKSNYKDGIYIENLIFNIEKALNPEEVYEIINNYKIRHSQRYSR